MSKLHTTHSLSTLTPEDLARYLGDRLSRKLAHNTYVERTEDGLAIRFHATRILTFHSDGSFTVSTGGWHTVTTKQRLNALMPAGYRIHSERYVWKMSTPEGVFDFSDGDRWGVPTPWRPSDCTTPHGPYLYCGPSCYVPAPVVPAPVVPHFHAGHNDPGYLPEGDVEVFDTFDEARGYLVAELLDTAETMASWADDGHECDDIPCPTYGDECLWQLAGSVELVAGELGQESGPEWQDYVSDGRSLPVSWWISECVDAECKARVELFASLTGSPEASL